VPHGPDDGTIAPWSSLAAIPFAPDIAVPAAQHFFECYPDIIHDHMLPSGFNPTLAADGRSAWVSDSYLGLEQGIVVLMIENHRSQLIWKLMRQCPHIGQGLRRAGFEGGWL
jgi:hypothetical protein